MTADGSYTAVLDRFEGDLAVLLLEDGEEVVDEIVVSEWRLPESARHQDAVLAVEVRDGDLDAVDYDPDESERRTSEAQSRFDRLASRPEESDSGSPSDSDGEP